MCICVFVKPAIGCEVLYLCICQTCYWLCRCRLLEVRPRFSLAATALFWGAITFICLSFSSYYFFAITFTFLIHHFTLMFQQPLSLFSAILFYLSAKKIEAIISNFLAITFTFQLWFSLFSGNQLLFFSNHSHSFSNNFQFLHQL